MYTKYFKYKVYTLSFLTLFYDILNKKSTIHARNALSIIKNQTIHICATYDHTLEVGKAMISKGYAYKHHVNIGDSIYINSFDQEVIVKEILQDQLLDDFGKINQEYIYLSNEYFIDIPTNQILIVVDSFDHINTVKELIKEIKTNVVVEDATYSNIVHNDMQVSLIDYLSLFTKIMIVIVFTMFIFIEIKDQLSHKYEFALLKTNGLTQLDLLQLLIIRSIIQSIGLIILSVISVILFNQIYIVFNYIEQAQLLNHLMMVIPAIIIIKTISTIISCIYLHRSDPLILIKK